MKQFLKYQLLKHGNIEVTVLGLLAILIFIISAFIIYKIVKKLLSKSVSSGHIDEGRKFAVARMLKYLLYVIVITMSLNAVGIDVTIFIAGSAALLVGLGLGVKQIFNDIVSGIILLIEGELKVGDQIEADGISGVVREIGIRTSKVLTNEATIAIVPNSKFVSEKVTNWGDSLKPTRFYIEVGVTYNSNTEIVRKILLDAAAKHDNDIEKEPAPFIRLENFGETMIAFRLYFFSRRIGKVEHIKSEMREYALQAFHQNSITVGADKESKNAAAKKKSDSAE